MNRTGLLLALGVAVIVGVVFGVYPELDLTIARLFDDPATARFSARSFHALMILRSWSMGIIVLVIAPAVLALVLKLLFPAKPMFMSARAAVFLIATLALGPGLLVNATLKDYWARPRPIDVREFGGVHDFVPWWDFRGDCVKNCSFVAGEGSGAFWTLAAAALAPAPWRAAAYGAALVFGSLVGVLRMAFGGHFFTDVVFAGVLMFILIWIVHGLLYRWRSRISEATLEHGIGAIVLPFHRLIAAIAARLSKRQR